MLRDRRCIADQVFRDGKCWVIAGLLIRHKSLGKLTFSTLRDCTGQIQVIFPRGESFSKNSFLAVRGTLVPRKSPNHGERYGEWELLATHYELLSAPLKVSPLDPNSLEPMRLKYRYLDLRSGTLYANLCDKSRIISILRNYLISQKFVEIFTPVLSIPSEEGARTFDTRFNRNGKLVGFSLAQSPQLYKQLLMIGGVERYFQVANCFRLEDLRADRQYEFLQLDLEVSLMEPGLFFKLIEGLFRDLWSRFLNSSCEFITMDYEDALSRYGSDKPDPRHGGEIIPVREYLLNPSHDYAYSIFFPSLDLLWFEEKWMSSIVTSERVYISKVTGGRESDTALLNLNYPGDKVGPLFRDLGFLPHGQDGTLITVMCGPTTRKNSLLTLGNMRLFLSGKSKLELRNGYTFIWVVNWPLFEYNESKKNWEPSHHLFTKPRKDSIPFERGTPSWGYDLVLNGVELASGSVRNNSLEVQRYIFGLANLPDDYVERNFGWFLEAFNYGVPPHMGIAIGLDRLVQVMLELPNIREAIAFPKNNHGQCPMTGTPN